MTPAQVTQEQASRTNKHEPGQIQCLRSAPARKTCKSPTTPLLGARRVQSGSPFTVRLIRHPRGTKVSVPTSSPNLGTQITLGPKPPPSQHNAGSCATGAEEMWYLWFEPGGIPSRSRAPACPLRSSGPRPAAPGPPLLLQHHPRGGAVTSRLHPRRPRPVPAEHP